MFVQTNLRSDKLGVNEQPVELKEISGSRATVILKEESHPAAKGYKGGKRQVDIKVSDIHEYLGDITFEAETGVSLAVATEVEEEGAE